MSRFNLEKNYHFIRFLISGKHPMGNDISNPIKSITPWLYKDTHNKPEFKRLICLEHHKVPDESDPKQEPKYDGFRFACPQEIEGVTYWDNQYPTASYGQMTDTADRIVSSVIYKDDNSGQIADIVDFYLLDNALSSMWKLIAKGECKDDFVKEKIQDIFKEIDLYLEYEKVGILISKKELEKCTLVSLEICEANDQTISASQLLDTPWQESWI